MKKTLLHIFVLFACCISLAWSANFGTVSADGDTSTVTITGPFIFKANGTWGSGTFKVYYLSRTGSFKELVTATAQTSDATAQELFDLPPGYTGKYKATLSGSSSPSLLWEFVGNVQGN